MTAQSKNTFLSGEKKSDRKQWLGRPAAQIAERLNQYIFEVEKMLLFAAMATMMVCMTCVILSRYIQPLSLGHLSDVAVGLIPWVGLLGASAALYRGRHIGMVLLRDALPGKISNAARMVSDVVILSFLMMLVWAGWGLVERQIASGVTTSAMEIPRFLVTLSLPVGAGLAILHQLLFMFAGEKSRMAAAGEEAEHPFPAAPANDKPD